MLDSERGHGSGVETTLSTQIAHLEWRLRGVGEWLELAPIGFRLCSGTGLRVGWEPILVKTSEGSLQLLLSRAAGAQGVTAAKWSFWTLKGGAPMGGVKSQASRGFAAGEESEAVALDLAESLDAAGDLHLRIDVAYLAHSGRSYDFNLSKAPQTQPAHLPFNPTLPPPIINPLPTFQSQPAVAVPQPGQVLQPPSALTYPYQPLSSQLPSILDQSMQYIQNNLPGLFDPTPYQSNYPYPSFQPYQAHSGYPIAQSNAQFNFSAPNPNPPVTQAPIPNAAANLPSNPNSLPGAGKDHGALDENLARMSRTQTPTSETPNVPYAPSMPVPAQGKLNTAAPERQPKKTWPPIFARPQPRAGKNAALRMGEQAHFDKASPPPPPLDQGSLDAGSRKTNLGMGGIPSPPPITCMPGEISLEPMSKLVVGAPFDLAQLYRLRLTNSSGRQIGWAVTVSNPERFLIAPAQGLLEPRETCNVFVKRQPFNYRAEGAGLDRLTFQWMNAPPGIGKEFHRDWLLGKSSVRRRVLNIEYNP